MKPHYQKSIAWATCPHHVSYDVGSKEGKTGLIALDSRTLAFRPHFKKVGKITVPCPGSGLVYEGEVGT